MRRQAAERPTEPEAWNNRVMDVDWVRLELDLKRYEAPQVNPGLAAAGLQLATLAEIGDTSEARYRLFELNRECSADIPGRGPFHTWEEYCQRRLDVAWFNPSTVTLAVDGDEWVGLAGFTAHPTPKGGGDGYLFSEMTGVVRGWRRKGLATALKAHSLDLALTSDLDIIRTVQHSGNAPMIALNRQLGFVDASWAFPS